MEYRRKTFKKHFCEYQNIRGAQDDLVDFIEIEHFCETVAKIIKKHKHR